MIWSIKSSLETKHVIYERYILLDNKTYFLAFKTSVAEINMICSYVRKHLPYTFSGNANDLGRLTFQRSNRSLNSFCILSGS